MKKITKILLSVIIAGFAVLLMGAFSSTAIISDQSANHDVSWPNMLTALGACIIAVAMTVLLTRRIILDIMSEIGLLEGLWIFILNLLVAQTTILSFLFLLDTVAPYHVSIFQYYKGIGSDIRGIWSAVPFLIMAPLCEAASFIFLIFKKPPHRFL